MFSRIAIFAVWGGLAVVVGSSQTPSSPSGDWTDAQIPVNTATHGQRPETNGQRPATNGQRPEISGSGSLPQDISGLGTASQNVSSPIGQTDPGPLGAVFSPGTIVPSTNARPQMATAGDMIGFSHSDGSGNLTITLVHTGKSWMSVYHVDSKGTIQLASSRPIDADFSLQLNATDPLPEDIRAMKDRVRSGQ